MLDRYLINSGSSIAQAIELVTANIDNPTELNAIGTAVPDLRLVHEAVVGSDRATLYRLDADTDSVIAPYIMASATAGLRWVAIAGYAINQAVKLASTMAVGAGLTVTSNTGIAGTLSATGATTFGSGLTVSSNEAVSGTSTITGLITGAAGLSISSNAAVSGSSTLTGLVTASNGLNVNGAVANLNQGLVATGGNAFVLGGTFQTTSTSTGSGNYPIVIYYNSDVTNNNGCGFRFNSQNTAAGINAAANVLCQFTNKTSTTVDGILLFQTTGGGVGATRLQIGAFGDITVSQAVQTTGTPLAFKLNAAAHTTLTASAESNDMLLSLARTVQFATGAITTQRAVSIQAPTYAFVGASTITNAATLAVTNAPQVGTNATFTNAWALWIQAGASRFDGNLIGSIGRGTGVTSTVTSAGTQTLSATSTEIQTYTGSTAAQVIQFPAANLFGAGVAVLYTINNQSSVTVTPTRAGADTFQGGGTTDPVLAGASTRYASNGVSVWLKV